MKKNKHITINLNEAQYKKLEALATANRQTLTACAYWLLVDQLPPDDNGVTFETI